jgi:hypothetical protein
MPGGYVVRDANGQALVYVYSRATEAEANAGEGADAVPSNGRVPQFTAPNFWTKYPEKAGPANALGYGQVIG